MNKKIFIRESILSDGSFVYAVELKDANYDAITEKEARALASLIGEAIEKHTNEIVEIIEC